MTLAPQAAAPARPAPQAPTTEPSTRASRSKWWRFAVLLVITLLTMAPVLTTVLLAFRPAAGSAESSLFTLDNFQRVFRDTDVLRWLANSLLVACFTVIVSVVVAAPAGYVLSRGRGKVVGGFSLLLFVFQSLPVITSAIPLFILFSRMGLVDNLLGLTIVYVGSTICVTTWMMAAYFDSIPASLEEAAWVDGLSVFGSFTRVVLRNSLPGVLSAAVFAFLLAWNDYLVALVFLHSDPVLNLPVGLQNFFQQNATDWGGVMAVAVIMLLPPCLVFAALHKYFSVGGIGGALAGR